jgi:hypothetical protein
VPALLFDAAPPVSSVSSQKTLVFSQFSPLVIGSFTDSSPDKGLYKVLGRRRISFLRRAPALACNLEKGKLFSSNVTSREIYTRPAEISRHLNPL